MGVEKLFYILVMLHFIVKLIHLQSNVNKMNLANADADLIYRLKKAYKVLFE